VLEKWFARRDDHDIVIKQNTGGGVADFAGAGGDVVKGAPPAGEQRGPSFPEAAQGTLEGVAGAGIDVRFPAASSASRRSGACSARTMTTSSR